MTESAETYVKGFDGLVGMGQLGNLDVDAAYGMVSAVRAESPETAGAMWSRYMEARLDSILAPAMGRYSEHEENRRQDRVARLASRLSVSRESVEKALGDDQSRESAELRSLIYRM